MITLLRVPGATQDLVDLLGNGASQRIFRKFIESSYVTLEPERIQKTKQRFKS
jgi:hypothetical protein